MAAIGKTTAEVVIKYTIDHATCVEDIDDIYIVSNNPDPLILSPLKVVGMLSAAKEMILVDGLEAYTYEEVDEIIEEIQEESANMLFKCIKCGNTGMEVISKKNKLNKDVEDIGHYCPNCNLVYWIYKTEKGRKKTCE
jgi:predicted RNA-binding Zn-ribbon protein involved in translation (DUF1610 family)